MSDTPETSPVSPVSPASPASPASSAPALDTVIAPTLRLLALDADWSFVASYALDVQAIFERHADFLGSIHRDQGEFAQKVIKAGADLINLSADYNRENAEALQATRVQQMVLEKSTTLALRIRNLGRAIVDVLEEGKDTKDTKDAGKIRAAVGLSRKLDLRRQSFIRTLLAEQVKGLTEIHDLWMAWHKPDLRDEAAQSLQELTAAFHTQALEDEESRVAFKLLSQHLQETIKVYNQALLLIESESHRAPALLISSLLTAQGNHPRVYA